MFAGDLAGAPRLRARKRPITRLVAVVAALAVCLGLVAAGAEAETEEPAAVARKAYFTYPLTQVTPPLLLEGFPPSTVCLVAGLVGVAPLCGTEVAELADLLGIADGLPVVVTPDSDLVQPLAPNTLPVGMLAGQTRYVTLLQIGLPVLPAGEEFQKVELVLHQSGVNFALESPAFRDAITALIAQVDEPNPELFSDLLDKIGSGEVALFTETVTGIEMCPITQEWSGGSAQDAGLDGTRLPDANCILGTTGTFDPQQLTWTFDLTFAAQAWSGGGPSGETLENQGVILRPVGSPNLAFGDPDLSTNFLISLADEGAEANLRPMLRYTTGASASTGDGGGSITPDLGPTPLFPDTGFDTGGITAPVTPSSPALGPITARFAERDPADPETSAWLWLLVPIALALAYAFGESLLAVPPASRRRRGAMTRLMELRPTNGGAP